MTNHKKCDSEYQDQVRVSRRYRRRPSPSSMTTTVPRSARNPICDLFAVGEFVLVCWFPCSRICGHPVVCVCLPVSCSVFEVDVGYSWVSDACGQSLGRWQTQKLNTWLSGQMRAEKVLAEAVTIDGRKEWICKFCS